MSRFLLASVVLCVLFSVAAAGGGHGFGGYQQAILVQPVAPVAAVQPVMMQAKQRQYVQPVVQQQKRVNYAQPIVTYAQPIVQAVRLSDNTQTAAQQQRRAQAKRCARVSLCLMVASVRVSAAFCPLCASSPVSLTPLPP